MTEPGGYQNQVHVNGDSTYTKHFGHLVAVSALPMCHTQHIALWFRRGVRIDLTCEDAAALAASIPAALAALPIVPGTLAGHTWEATE